MDTTKVTEVATHPGVGFTYYARWLGRCRSCKRVVRYEVAADEAEPGWYILHQRLVACPHGCTSVGDEPRWVGVKMVTGTVSDRLCNATCTNAKGPSCDCSCAGANHGATS